MNLRKLRCTSLFALALSVCSLSAGCGDDEPDDTSVVDAGGSEDAADATGAADVTEDSGGTDVTEDVPTTPDTSDDTSEPDSGDEDTGPVDSDDDGIADDSDVCPEVADPEQLDLDEDGIGDACDDDRDGDDVANDVDNCPDVANPDQADWDTALESSTGLGDACAVQSDITGLWAGEWRTDTEVSPGTPALFGSVSVDVTEQAGALASGSAVFTGAPCFDEGPLTMWLEEEDLESGTIAMIGEVPISEETLIRLTESADTPPPEGCEAWELIVSGTIRGGERINAAFESACLPPPCQDEVGGTVSIVLTD